ncbi:SOUL family heme-binding protein [Halopelagius longus]|uniref:Heme-binding protein n=1 Tax=Halopelagius longus TaxID=1236180 RepID=A0A1H1BNA4_9EURY|nr:heme-binding protein [Halopelagius longus]RDI70856.1 heme-binding protein [Halopelagius longus]SDQ53495.1 SOUL heme-binding protein [Halopelagius longus]
MVRKRTLAYGGLAAASLVAGAAARVVHERRSTPSLPYESVGTVGGAELRRYPTTTVVETVAPSEHQAFGRLVRYVSGNNEAEADLSPLPTVVSEGETRRSPASESKSASDAVSVTASDSAGGPVSVTAPGGEESEADGVRMAFYLPESHDFESAPRPSDPKVRVVELPERTLAVTSLPRWSIGNRAEREGEKLRSTLREGSEDVQVVGDPFVLRYDGPGASSFLPPNEVAVEVRRVASRSE